MKTYNYLLLLSIKLLLLIPVNVFSQDINDVKIGIGHQPPPGDYEVYSSENNTFNITVPFGETLYFYMGCSNYHPWEPSLENAPSEIDIENLKYSSGTNYYYAYFSIKPSIPGSFTFDLVSTNTSSGNEVGRQTINLTVTPPQPDANNILYVNKNVSGGNQSGDSWANAIPELADALKWANLNQDPSWATTPLQIFVAKGTYNPLYSPEDGNFGNPATRDNAFLMVNNVQLYGGFDPASGIDDLTDERILLDDTTNTGTILNGDIGTPNTKTDNVYHVLMAVGDVGVARLDGFSVINGYADGYAQYLTVNGQSTVKDYGGGLYNYENANTIYTNLVVKDNEATNSGGGFYIRTSGPAISYSVIHNNTAGLGGGIYNFIGNSSLVIKNVSLRGNTASGYGGAISSASSGSLTLTNVGLFENNSPSGSSLYINSTTTTLLNVTSGGNSNSGLRLISTNMSTLNTIIWESVNLQNGGAYNAQNSIVKNDANTSNGNIDATLYTTTNIFTDPANGDYSLQNSSPATNAGDNTTYEAADGDTTNNSLANDVDLAGNPRVYDESNGGSIDMGAYEFQGEPSNPTSAFVTTWKTTTANESITIPINTNYTYNYNVDWGDGNTSTGQTGNTTHTYTTAGTYTISITGSFPAIRFLGSNNLITIEQWGTQVWQDMSQAFRSCYNLTSENATDIPQFAANVSLEDMFRFSSLFNADLNDWDVSNVTDMDRMFNNASGFNGNIGNWNVSNVTSMREMFLGAVAFNQNLNNWDVSNVTDMSYMFKKASVFNQDIGNWEVSSVTTMRSMFEDASLFSQDIGSWNVSSVTDMSYMLDNSGLSTTNYDSTLIGWAAQNVRANISLGAQGLIYCAAVSERQSLITNDGWTISGDIQCNTSPEITSNGGGSTASINVAENTTAVTTVTATDADAGAILTYSINGGADQSLFSINGTSGVLVFTTAPDFEAPTDANTDNQYEVSVEVSDGTDTDAQTITVIVTDENENTQPTAICQNITITLDVNGQASIVPADIDNGSSDSEGNVSLNLDVTTFDCSDLGDNTVILSVTDAANVTTTCTATVTVVDDLAPVPNVVTLPDIVKECTVVSADIPTPTATDNCEGIITATTSDPMNYSMQGTYTVTWNYDDSNGNTVSQTQTVIVDDTIAPIPDAANLPDITMECAVTSTDIPTPTATDNCEGSITATTSDPLNYSTQGTYTIAWNYDDGNGNTVSQMQTVIVDDVTTPVPDMASLPDIVKECAVTAADIPVPTAMDNCTGSISGTTSDPLNYSTQGTYTITWNYDDGNGNTVSQTQTVIVDDTIAPIPDVASLPDIVKECAVTAADIPVPTAMDNCRGSISGTTSDPLNYSTQGNYTITWNYDDGNGNTVSQTQMVIVDDTIAPIPDAANLPDITMECAVTSADIPTPTATDNCEGSISATTSDPLNYSTQGTYTITWNYDDGNGNTVSQTQTVIVDDTIAPIPDVANLPDITMGCAVVSADIPTPTASDNCVGIITATTSDPLSYSTQGTYIITWNYDDGKGNTVSQTQTIIVQPSPLEQVIFNDVTVTYDGTLHTIQVGNVPSGASVSYSINPSTGTPNGAIDAGIYTITAVVTPPSSAVNCDPITLTATLTIEQAAQQIVFDPLPIKSLEDDPDFQLQATATSGLLVSYTYTFTAPNPPATVTPSGFVALLTSGLIQITAHQGGNANYLPAAPVTQPLQINSRDASIHLLSIENEQYADPGPEVYYLIACGTSKNEVDVSMETETNATVVPAHNFTIETPKPGIYTQEVVVTSQDGSTTRTYVIRVEKRFNFEAITEQKFDNVLLVNNNPQTNGGYKFVAYEWYRNNTLVGREQYYSAGGSIQDLLDPNASWHVKMTTVDGQVLQTCVGSVTLEHTYAIHLWPNPVPDGRAVVDLFFDFPKNGMDNMLVSLYSLSGKLVKQVKIDQRKTKLHLPPTIASGVYLVLCESPQFKKTFKIIVE